MSKYNLDLRKNFINKMQNKLNKLNDSLLLLAQIDKKIYIKYILNKHMGGGTKKTKYPRFGKFKGGGPEDKAVQQKKDDQIKEVQRSYKAKQNELNQKYEEAVNQLKLSQETEEYQLIEKYKYKARKEEEELNFINKVRKEEELNFINKDYGVSINGNKTDDPLGLKKQIDEFYANSLKNKIAIITMELQFEQDMQRIKHKKNIDDLKRQKVLADDIFRAWYDFDFNQINNKPTEPIFQTEKGIIHKYDQDQDKQNQKYKNDMDKRYTQFLEKLPELRQKQERDQLEKYNKLDLQLQKYHQPQSQPSHPQPNSLLPQSRPSHPQPNPSHPQPNPSPSQSPQQDQPSQQQPPDIDLKIDLTRVDDSINKFGKFFIDTQTHLTMLKTFKAQIHEYQALIDKYRSGFHSLGFDNIYVELKDLFINKNSKEAFKKLLNHMAILDASNPTDMDNFTKAYKELLRQINFDNIGDKLSNDYNLTSLLKAKFYLFNESQFDKDYLFERQIPPGTNLAPETKKYINFLYFCMRFNNFKEKFTADQNMINVENWDINEHQYLSFFKNLKIIINDMYMIKEYVTKHSPATWGIIKQDLERNGLTEQIFNTVSSY